MHVTVDTSGTRSGSESFWHKEEIVFTIVDADWESGSIKTSL
jgi:hypothetical protein